MKTKILLVMFGIAMLVAFSLIPDRPTMAYPPSTPVPPEYDGAWISFANCEAGYMQWDYMPGWYEYSFIQFKLIAADYSEVIYYPGYFYTQLGDSKWWKANFDSSLHGKNWWVYGQFLNNLGQVFEEWSTTNDWQIFCGGNAKEMFLPGLSPTNLMRR